MAQVLLLMWMVALALTAGLQRRRRAGVVDDLIGLVGTRRQQKRHTAEATNGLGLIAAPFKIRSMLPHCVAELPSVLPGVGLTAKSGLPFGSVPEIGPLTLPVLRKLVRR